MLPGFPHNTPSGETLRYTEDAADVDVYVDAGSPTGPVVLNVIVESGVYIYATNTGTPAMDFSGFDDASRIVLQCAGGKIRGAGGAGGTGRVHSMSQTPNQVDMPSGGGGAGFNDGAGVGGLGGTNNTVDPELGLPGRDGLPGSETNGGFGGAYLGSFWAPPREATNGFPGGPAIRSLDVTMTINNTGTIWGGGGGGAGQVYPGVPYPGANGGGPGEAGDNVDSTPHSPTYDFFGGAAGYAVEGTSVFFSDPAGGLTPKLEGPIG